MGSYLSGVINPLLSIVAIILLWLTYKSQKAELHATQVISKKQSDTLERQQFESTFFNLLEQLQSIVSSMVHENKRYGEGRLYLRNFIILFKGKLLDSLKKNGNDKEYMTQQMINEYTSLFESQSHNLGHYFRFIHNIIKYTLVEIGIKNKEEVNKYLGILQSMLSNDEMWIIFMNCHSKYSLDQTGQPKFKNWIDEYGLLENMTVKYFERTTLLDSFPNTKFRFRTLVQNSEEENNDEIHTA
jgi:hypothetical protein